MAEYEARGEVERVYHEIKQVLRVSGVNLNFRTWAGYEKFLPLMWDAIRPNLETRYFEEAADQVRAEAASAAQTLGPLKARTAASLGESQDFQVGAALDLYHYINPKLLVLTSAVVLSLNGEHIGGTGEAQDLLPRGTPARMYPMEMESEKPADPYLQEIFDDIKRTLALPSVNSDYRTLALWPSYLGAVWERLKPIVLQDEYRHRADQLRQAARSLARQLPHPLPLDRPRVQEAGEDADAVAEVSSRFEQLLPGLIINVALCELDWRSGQELEASPFPAPSRQQDTGGTS